MVRQAGSQSLCVTPVRRAAPVQLRATTARSTRYAIEVADTVGAGDAFAAAFVHGLGQGWGAAQIGDFANRVGALVASRHGAIPDWTIDECLALRRGSRRSRSAYRAISALPEWPTLPPEAFGLRVEHSRVRSRREHRADSRHDPVRQQRGHAVFLSRGLDDGGGGA